MPNAVPAISKMRFNGHRCQQHAYCVLVIVLLQITVSLSLPVNKETLPTIDELKFMQKFGYLDTPDSNSEALYRHEAVVLAIKSMQKFGALPETGIMDNATKELLITPRCGVADVVKNRTSTTSRHKRFVIASDGWKKQYLTYFLANWSPKLGSRERALAELDRAFKVWSDYSPLRFTHVEDPNADIVVAFGNFYHGDGYPFDGPGNTLAHAYFPYEFDSFGGDVHLDDDENWIIGRGDGTDFFTVTTHELGHSLGLAHSYDYKSIMFPYYKGFSNEFALGYDDILAMHQLYVQKTVFEDEPRYPERYPDNDPPVRDDDRDDDKTDDSDKKGDTDGDDEIHRDEADRTREEEEENNEVDGGNADDDDRTRVEPTVGGGDKTDGGKTHDVTPPPTPKPSPPKIADICDGTYDTIALIRGEMFVFTGEYMWRFRERQKLEAGYPTKFRYMFDFPKPITKIDAAYENEIDGNIYFFAGRNVYTFDGYKFLDQAPRTLTDLGIQSNINKLDAAFVWGKNGKTYFISGSEYWRYNGTTKVMELNYPQGMTNWRNVPYPVDSVMRWKDGITYFFVGKKFYRFNDSKVKVEANYPQPALQYWFGCPDEIKKPLNNHKNDIKKLN